MNVKRLDSMIEKQLEDLSINITKQKLTLKNLESIKESYSKNLDGIEKEGHERIQSVIDSITQEHNNSKKIVNELEQKLNKINEITSTAEKENEKIMGYIDSIDSEAKIIFEKVEENYKLEVDNINVELQSLKSEIERVNSSLKDLVKKNHLRVRNIYFLWAISFAILFGGIAVLLILR